MNKIEIELTDEQLEKVKHLESKDISVGEAIDMLFEAKEKTLSELEAIDEEISLFDKVKDSTLDVDSKAENLEENYGDSEKTFDQQVLQYKTRLSWAKDFFKF
ncbi:MAG: hypothetical protein U0L42_00210 [Methanobrevibacter sp.]|uniref:hypothetical protein n=1 Tax=Methanobrevibacter sp. TaxID=66852 RepID=UPI002E793ED6|nr:hypothetical protein [Methanobrevibacter sp.]MEE0934071.1 hypothetical protein [Methanobrevibacter sp.]